MEELPSQPRFAPRLPVKHYSHTDMAAVTTGRDTSQAQTLHCSPRRQLRSGEKKTPGRMTDEDHVAKEVWSLQLLATRAILWGGGERNAHEEGSHLFASQGTAVLLVARALEAPPWSLPTCWGDIFEHNTYNSLGLLARLPINLASKGICV